MERLQTPVPIVTQAESATELPGLRKLCAALKERTLNARTRSAESRLERLEIAREVRCYGERPEVQAEVERLNAAERNKPGYKGGRPYAGHSIAAQALAKACGFDQRTLYRWASEWTNLCRQMDWQPTMQETIQTRLKDTLSINPSIADWFEKIATVDDEGPEPNPFEPVSDPQELKKVIYRKLEALGKAVGKTILQPRARQLWADAVEGWWQAQGIEVQVTFPPRKEKPRK